MRVLTVNAGSSSLKLTVLDDDDAVLSNQEVDIGDAKNLDKALTTFLKASPPFDAVGHRVVHGGAVFREPMVLNNDIDDAIKKLSDLDPLHNAPSLAAIHALQSLRPDVTQVACFDTSFHINMPIKASTYAIPQSWSKKWDIRRYGFHGLSHEWASYRAGALLGQPREELRLVTAHLGSGASLAAVAYGRSVDTTMGFTPMEGLVMSTRSGSIDPGLILWVQRHGGLSADDVETALERESGLLGLSGETGDLRKVIALVDAGDERAQLAYDVYVYRIQTNVAAMCAAMNGLDALVFTGGAGEASPRLRHDVCAGLGFLGVRLHPSLSKALEEDHLESAPNVQPAVLVVKAREDIEIAHHVRDLLS
jgi:acetate kinase